MRQALIFKFWVIFDKIMSIYSQEIAKKTIKNLLFGAIPDMEIPSKSCLKRPRFWSTTIPISPKQLNQI